MICKCGSLMAYAHCFGNRQTRRQQKGHVDVFECPACGKRDVSVRILCAKLADPRLLEEAVR